MGVVLVFALGAGERAQASDAHAKPREQGQKAVHLTTSSSPWVLAVRFVAIRIRPSIGVAVRVASVRLNGALLGSKTVPRPGGQATLHKVQ